MARRERAGRRLPTVLLALLVALLIPRASGQPVAAGSAGGAPAGGARVSFDGPAAVLAARPVLVGSPFLAGGSRPTLRLATKSGAGLSPLAATQVAGERCTTGTGRPVRAGEALLRPAAVASPPRGRSPPGASS